MRCQTEAAMRRLPVILSLVVAAALVLSSAVPQPVAKRRAAERSKDLWATVNICDTARYPDRIGVRGSMPGLGRRARLFMRFRVQYLDGTDGEWRDISENADTGWVRIGRARRKVLEAGHTFKFLPPSGGGAHTLRGAVTFRWRARGRTIKKVREITEAGHRSTTADPRGFSAAICRIS